jgi:multidrug resistance protein MdtO
MINQRPKRSEILKVIRQELAPYPGRLAGSLRDTLGILVSLVCAMMLRVPGISLALALLFLTQRERPGLTLRSGLQIVGGASFAYVASVAWVQMTDDTEAARFLGVVLEIFVAAFCMSTTTIPLFFTIFGFYGFLNLAAWDTPGTPNVLVTAGLHSLASLVIVVLCATGVEYLFTTRHPEKDLLRELRKRIRTLSAFFHLMADEPSAYSSPNLRTLHSTILQYAYAGDRHMNELYDRLRDSSPDISRVPIGIHYRIGLLCRVMEKTAILGFLSERTADVRSYYAVLALQCDGMENRIQTTEPLPQSAPFRLKEIDLELRQYIAGKERPDILRPRRQPSQFATAPAKLFLPGVFKQADSALYALKLTLAATTCYTFYNAIAWPGILTCVVTVLFTGLSSTGAMKQKQLYRFSGAAIGGALGIATVCLFFPNMDSITSLVIVVGVISIFSAWVLRSPRMSYVGVQIGFAYFLTTLPGFSAATLITPARDRLIGISLGILVMWFIFDQIWPVRTSMALSHVLQRIRKAVSQLREVTRKNDAGSAELVLSQLRITVSRELANIQLLESAAYFDFGKGHKREVASSKRLIRQIEIAAAEFYDETQRLNDEDALETH